MRVQPHEQADGDSKLPSSSHAAAAQPRVGQPFRLNHNAPDWHPAGRSPVPGVQAQASSGAGAWNPPAGRSPAAGSSMGAAGNHVQQQRQSPLRKRSAEAAGLHGTSQTPKMHRSAANGDA